MNGGRLVLAAAAAALTAALGAAPAGAAECASKGSRTLHTTSLVRVYSRTGTDGGRVYLACHRPSDSRRRLVREPRGERFRSVRVSVRGTQVRLRYRTATSTCTRVLDVATGDGGGQCVT